MDNVEATHPIQVVARRTGLSPDAIRAWERRYRVVSPQRSPGGRRLYTDADVQRLRLLRQATLAGRRIGDVAGLSDSELAALVAEDQAARRASGPSAEPPAGGSASAYLKGCRRAVAALDAPRLERLLGEASVALSAPVLVQEVIAPLMYAVGHGWRQGALRVGHEHMATHVVRTFLARALSAANPSGAAARVLVTTPSGQRHELGALMAAVLAAADGWQALYLAPDTPAAEIAAAAQGRAQAVLLGVTYPPNDPAVQEELRRLRELLPQTAILVGGQAAASYQEVIQAIGAQWLDDLAVLRPALDALRADVSVTGG